MSELEHKPAGAIKVLMYVALGFLGAALAVLSLVGVPIMKDVLAQVSAVDRMDAAFKQVVLSPGTAPEGVVLDNEGPSLWCLPALSTGTTPGCPVREKVYKIPPGVSHEQVIRMVATDLKLSDVVVDSSCDPPRVCAQLHGFLGEGIPFPVYVSTFDEANPPSSGVYVTMYRPR